MISPKRGVWGAAAWLGFASLLGCSGGGDRPPAGAADGGAPPAEPPAQVAVATVQRVDLRLFAEATGHLRPLRQVEVRSESAGRVVALPVGEGQRVDAGQVLLSLDDRDERIDLAAAEADLLRARADLVIYLYDFSRDGQTPRPEPVRPGAEDAREELERAQELFDEGLIPRSELEDARRLADAVELMDGSRRGEVQAVKVGLPQAEQRLERARLALERTTVAAPFAGRIADVAVEVGQEIDTGQSCLTLVDDSRFEADVEVLEADLVWLRPGAAASVRVPALDDLVVPGTVASINPIIDADSGTGHVTVAIDSGGSRLLPGLFAVTELAVRSLPARLVVPEEAVLVRQGRELVFRVSEGRALWSYVTTGARSGGLVEILDGVAEGDRVAVDGHFALAHNAPVSVMPAPG